MPSSTRCPTVRPLATALLLAAGACASPAFAGKMMTSGLQAQQEFDQFIVKYRDGSIERRDVNALNRGLERVEQRLRTEAAMRGFAKAGRASDVKVSHHRRMSMGADVVRTGRRLDRSEAEALMRQIAADPNVDYVEVDVRLYPLLTPNDTNYGVQWGYNDADAGINAPAAWDLSTGTGIIVAVLDTGITTHSDLAANLVAGYDFVSSATNARDGNGRDSNPADQGDWSAAGECYTGSQASNSSWHGTHVAGTVAAVTNNAKGVAGTAFGAKVMPVRVLAKCGGSTSDIADAITWASGGTVSGVPTLSSANVAKVINMSLGGGGACGTTQQNAINGAVARGTTVVVAAGNSANDAANNNPANCANVITVAAVDSAGRRSIWLAGVQESSYGTVVDIAAPGTQIASTINAGTTTPSTESYTYNSGTSMAAPHVAGVAALVQSRRLALGQPLYTPSQLESLLKTTARPFPVAPASNRLIGAGIVNASGSVVAAGGGGGGGTVQTYTNSADYQIRDRSTVESPITVSGRSGNAPVASAIEVDIRHSYISDLKVDLVAPDGSIYTVHNRTGGSADNIITNFTVNLSSELLNGTWRLRVYDGVSGDTGYINSWSIKF